MEGKKNKNSKGDNSNNNSGFNFAHYKKLNIIGAKGVGKRSLLTFMEKYDQKEYELPEQEELSNSNNSAEEKEEKDENTNTTLICEEVTKIKVNYNKNKKLYFNCYITNLSDTNIDYFLMNLDALLSYTQCVLVMIDITSPESFTLLANVIHDIIRKMSTVRELRNIPIYFISNKIDLEMVREVSGYDIKELLDKFEGILKSTEISLKTKENLYFFLDELLSKLASDFDEKNKGLIFDEKNFVEIQDPPSITLFNEGEGKKSGDINTNDIPRLKFIILGSVNVGKTAFIKYFFHNKFSLQSKGTIGIDIEKTFAKVDEHIVGIEIYDTAGQEKYRSINKKFYCRCDGFLLLYDVTNKKTFDGVTEWIKSIRNERGKDKGDYSVEGSDEVMFLVGNKIDNKTKRQVTQEDGIALATKFNLKYYETSCKIGINIYEIMNDLILESFSKMKGDNDSFHIKREKNRKFYGPKAKNCC